MILEIYSVFDTVSKSFTQPFYQVNEGVARRNIAAAVNNKEHNFHVAPGDYDLYRVGKFDDQTGKIEGENERICNLAAFYKEQEK